MKKLIVSALMVTLFATMVLGQATAPSIEGNWLGSLDLGGAKLRLVFKITKTAAGYQAKFDSPDQGATDLDVDSVTVQDGVVKLGGGPGERSWPPGRTISAVAARSRVKRVLPRRPRGRTVAMWRTWRTSRESHRPCWRC